MRPEIINVALRIIGDGLEPQTITNSIGLTPTHTHAKEDDSRGFSGRQYGVWNTGVWTFDAPIQKDIEFEPQLTSFLLKLRDKQSKIKYFASMGLKCEIFVGLRNDTGNFGFILPKIALKLLAEIGLEIDFDIYNGK